ncbi:hypothetical protein [Agromyces sp. SYSU T0242]|uniref:hypothetical protein n=1 Tax=Agromyces litoreus TaxID=3158561 RepID=UPI003394EE2B
MARLFSSIRTAVQGPEILELRIHGVKNSPPAQMLGAAPEQVRRRTGDELGSFWRRDDDHPQDGIQSVEAFSWGAQARAGGGALAVIGRAAVHVGWFLLLPYALANLAYWTRRIDAQESAGAKKWNGSAGAATVRVFGLVLTLITVAAFCSVAIDLVAIQCFRDGAHVCAALPGWFDALLGLERDSRAALFGLLPVAAMLVLYLIGRRGRVRFEERLKTFGAGLGDPPPEAGRPLLATRGFWSVARVGPTSERLHLAASILLVLILLAIDDVCASKGTECFPGGITTLDLDWAGIIADHPVPAVVGIAGMLLMAGIVVLIILASHVSSSRETVVKRALALVALVASIAGYAGWLIWTAAREPTGEQGGTHFVGLIATPIILIVLALFLALAGVGWKSRSRTRRAISAVLLVVGGAMLLASHHPRVEAWWAIGVAVASILVHLAVSWSTPGTHRRQAWRGQGAAVAMLLALFAAMALSSLLVLGVASWLGTSTDSPATSGIFREPAVGPTPAEWDIPDAYERFAVVLTVIVVLMIIVLLAAVGWNFRRFVRFSLPPLEQGRGSSAAPVRTGDTGSDDEVQSATRLGGVVVPDPEEYPERLAHPTGRVRRRAEVRRSSQLLHRGEPLFGWLAVLAAVGFLSLSSAAVYEWCHRLASLIDPALPGVLRSASVTVLAGVAVAAVAAVVVHATASSERPLGVFWDVVSFFPRAGHPFAPPCYGERVVPELSTRIQGWLDEADAGRDRGVILSAHSMGSTIAAATILALRGESLTEGPMAGTEVVDRVALLSYGSQLRGYFSRFFPSVFGPEALGVPGAFGPSLWASDPWSRQVLREFAGPVPEPAQGADLTLTGILGASGRDVPRWRNLWRRTDFLGFPVYGYRGDGNPVDRGATETAPGRYLWSVATHDAPDYFGTPQYAVARDELVRALGGRS